LKKGEIHEFVIEDYAFEGKGIARVKLEEGAEEFGEDKKFVVFVNGSYPGDKVKALLTKVKKRYAEGRVEEVIEASPDRVKATCDFFYTCGGCKQQDLDYEAQLRYKKEQVKDLFEVQAGISGFEMEPAVGADKIFHYRNKMEFSFSDKRWIPKAEFSDDEMVEDRNFALGLHIPRVYDKVLDINNCHLQNDVGNKILNFTRAFFKPRNTSIYSTKTHEGYLRNLVIKLAHHTEDVMVNLVTHTDDEVLFGEYAELLKKEIPAVTTIINNVNLKKAQIALGDYEKIYLGDGFMFDNIGKYKYRISANSFFQTNTLQAEKLYDIVLEYADLNGDEIVYDLYSGAGTISIYVSEKAHEVYAIESVEPAVEDAKVNATLNNISNVKFILGDLNKSFLPILNEQNIPNPDVIIADPPRSGMNPKTIRDIENLSPKKIVYISCNPASQMRDIKLLVTAGYRLIKMRSVDMFPQTYHIENVALLIKN